MLLLKRSILTEKIARRGHHLLREYRVDPFALATVSEVMTREVQTLPANMTLEQALAFLADPETRHPSFPVIDEQRRVSAWSIPCLVQSWLRAGKPPESVIGALLVGTTVPLAHPDEYLEGVITRMMRTNAGHVPVIAAPTRSWSVISAGGICCAPGSRRNSRRCGARSSIASVADARSPTRADVSRCRRGQRARAA